MQQLNIFNTHNLKPSVKRKIGRPNKITPEIVFNVFDALKRRKPNKSIISKYQLTERTFFRIKKGHYNHLLKQYLNESVNDFSLCLSD
jgi:hypothetical protein